jgi:hypothetical protein
VAGLARQGQCGEDFLNDPTFLKADGDSALFGCRYATARLTYSAVEITSPAKRYDAGQNPVKKTT